MAIEGADIVKAAAFIGAGISMGFGAIVADPHDLNPKSFERFHTIAIIAQLFCADRCVVSRIKHKQHFFTGLA